MPVLDGGLVMTVGGDDEQPRINAVRGRVFPGLDLSTDPASRRGWRSVRPGG